MRLRNLAFTVAATGTAMAVYGALVEARRLVVVRETLRLARWPKRLNGLKIAVIGDLHVTNARTAELARQAVELALDEVPDLVVLVGDFVGHWTTDVPRLLGDALLPLLAMEGNAIAIPGNHDYHRGDPSLLKPIFDELNVRLLRNELYRHMGVAWAGIDSFNEGKAELKPVLHALHKDEPAIALWHEPDPADLLPRNKFALQISGHSHGGQFIFPGGFAPMHTKHGRKYVRGFYPEAPTPVYVTSGVGTTLLPTRFLCPPEVVLLTLVGR